MRAFPFSVSVCIFKWSLQGGPCVFLTCLLHSRHVLTWRQNLSQVHLVLFLLQAGISSFFKEPCFLLVEDGF